MKFRQEIHFGNRLVRAYAERPSSVIELLWRSVEAAPDRIAVTDAQSRVSYAALWSFAVAFAQLDEIRSLPKGSRIIVMVGNSAEFAAAFFGCILAGHIPIPAGLRLRRPELAYIARDAGAAAAVFDEPFADEIPGPDDLDSTLVHVPVPGRFAMAGRAPVTPPAARSLIGVHEDDTACILYTSGTTGNPKGAMLTHFNLIHSALHWRDMLDLKAGESTVLVVPAAHVTGIAGILVPFLAIAGTVHMVREFKAGPFLEFMARERVSHALLVPAMYNLCLRTDEIGSVDLSAWKVGLFGGAPMPVPTIERYGELLPGLAMRNAYGATETTSPTTIMPLAEHDPPHDSVGRVVPCGHVVVVDEEGREVAPGQSGELLIAGPMVVPGYWNNPAANEAGFVSGYWRSGDIGAVDADGFLRVHDRKKDMINRGGYKIYPAEVESVLQGVVGLIEVAIFGYADEVLGEKSHAVIVSHGDALTGETVRDHCRQRLSDYKVPDKVTIITDPLPRNANGKVQKTVLRDRFG